MQTAYNKKIRNLVLTGLLIMVLIVPIARHAPRIFIFIEHFMESALEQAREERAQTADPLKSMQAQKHPESTVIISDQELAGVSSEISYYIIVGSFTNPVYAKVSADGYAMKGYETNIITSINRKGENISMVSVSSFNEAGKAKSFLQEFHQNVSPGAWLYIAN